MEFMGSIVEKERRSGVTISYFEREDRGTSGLLTTEREQT